MRTFVTLLAIAAAGMFAQDKAPSYGTSSDEAQAHEAVMRFMRGIQLADLPEGKKLLEEIQWITGRADRGENFYSRPDYSEMTSIFSGLFDTDIPSVKGYKELFDLAAVTKAGGTKRLKFLVIAYRDIQSANWKVIQSLDNSDGGSVDIDHEVAFFRGNLADTQVTSAKENYFAYGHWLLLAGKIKDARVALETARAQSGTPPPLSIAGINISIPSNDVRDVQVDLLIEVISRISPLDSR